MRLEKLTAIAMPVVSETSPIDVHRDEHDPEYVLPTVLSEDGSTLGLVEMVLKDPRQLDLLLRDEVRLPELIPRMLAIAMAGFTVYGLVLTLVLNLAAIWPAWVPLARWDDASVFNLALAYNLGLIAANGICLPSFYFYGLLAGVRISMLSVTAHAMKGMAVGAVALVGILPIYLALVLGAFIFELPPSVVEASVSIGLALPFIAGLWAARSLFVGFVSLAETMPREQRCRRECFLRRLTFSWTACYTAVTPLAIYTIWHELSGLPGY